ncbi:F-box/FBD/LRR-repeat protein At5g53840-like, partial [Fagus crenata]
MVSKKTKIVQPDSEFALLKCDNYKTQNYPKDRIGELPDEILVLILSLLPTEEAIRTSVLTHFDDDTVVSLLFCRPPSPTPNDFDLEPTYPPFLVQRRRFVDWVTGEVLEYFLCACPLLEFLYVSMSRIGNLKISGPSLRLKHLDISYSMLDSLDIYVENLVSFTYRGLKKNISFKYTPKLVMANIAGPYVCYFIKSLFQLPSYISQLETLVLGIEYEKLTRFPKLPKLRNLKQLELVLNHRVFCLLLCTSLLRASPSLNRFTIE